MSLFFCLGISKFMTQESVSMGAKNSVSFMEDKRAIIGGTIMTDMMNMLMTNYYWVEVILAVGMAIYYGLKVFDKK